MSWFDKIPIQQYYNINKQAILGNYKKPSVSNLDIQCGPILKLCGTLENGSTNYRASILLVLKDPQQLVRPIISYQLGPALPLHTGNSLVTGAFESEMIHYESGSVFWRFNINFILTDIEQKCKYFINDDLSFEFFIPSIHQSMNIISYSCNGFSLATETSVFKSSMWLDVLKNHNDLPYHVMIGGGDQIYSDSIKISVPDLQDYLNERNPLKKHNYKCTEKLQGEICDYYLNNYIEWFGSGYWKGKNGETLQALFPIAMSQIPSLNIFDDHDIIDGFGSYHNTTMNHDIMRYIGNAAYKYYMLFQQHISVKEYAYMNDPSWVISKSEGPYIKEKSHSLYTRLGKDIAFLGVDCRTERTLHQIITKDTYDLLFQRLQHELEISTNKINHVLILLGVPIAYPRLVWLESLLTSPFLKPITKLAQMGIVAKGLVNEFDGSVEVLDDLNDHWCSKTHKKERNAFIQKLVQFGSSTATRITILSGDVHLGCISRFKSKMHSHHLSTQTNYDLNKIIKNPEYDPRLMFNVISSAIVNAPPPNAMANLLNKRAKLHKFDHETDEDVVPVFIEEENNVNYGGGNMRFNNRRNWSDLIPAANSRYKDFVDQGIARFPGPIENERDADPRVIDKYQKLLGTKSEKKPYIYIKYPLSSDALIATLHVEEDHSSLESSSVSYEVIIPPLKESYKLENIGVKD